jgi:carbamoyl-phosphate synthase large subunit
VFNTTEGSKSISDSKVLRRTTLEQRVPYYTTIAAAKVVARAISKVESGSLDVRPLQSYI